MTDLYSIKKGERVTIRRTITGKTNIVGFDTVKSICKKWISMTGGRKYGHDGNKWGTLGYRSFTKETALPYKDGDQESYDDLKRQEEKEYRKGRLRSEHEAELRGRYFEAIEAEMKSNPSPLFRALVHYANEADHNYDLLEKL